MKTIVILSEPRIFEPCIFFLRIQTAKEKAEARLEILREGGSELSNCNHFYISLRHINLLCFTTTIHGMVWV